MDQAPLCIESDSSLDLLKNGIDPLIDIKIKEEEVDLGEDTIEMSQEGIDSLILCPKCAYTTHSETMFLRHYKHHQDSDKKPLTCAKCEYATTHRGELNIHTITKHPPDDKVITNRAPDLKIKSNPKFLCGSCEFVASSKRSLCRHLVMNQMHTLKDVFICGGKCLFRTNRRSSLIEHLQRHHSKFHKEILQGAQPKDKRVGAPPDDAIYKCSKCKFRGQRHLLQAHMVKEHPHIQIDFFFS